MNDIILHGMRTGLTVAMVTVCALLFAALPLPAADISLGLRAGYSPHIGGTMRSGWQADPANLGVVDGLNDINRSSDTIAVSTIEVPVAAVGAIDLMFAGEALYFKTGVWGQYTVAGGTGSTINPAGTEAVEVSYSQWSVDVPFTFGISLVYWNESRIYMGCGVAFAYGMSMMSFSSPTLDHSATFAGYAVPLVAELGCEYITGEHTSIGCGIRYMYGKSSVIKKGTDYAVVDFSGYIFTASASLHFHPGGM